MKGGAFEVCHVSSSPRRLRHVLESVGRGPYSSKEEDANAEPKQALGSKPLHRVAHVRCGRDRVCGPNQPEQRQVQNGVGPVILNFGDVRCNLTLEGSFHSSTLQKRAEALIGYISRAIIAPPAQCTNGE